MAENWRCPEFRQYVVTKINKAIASSTLNTNKTGTDMESHVFAKDEYLGYVAELILHLLNSKIKSDSSEHNADNSVAGHSDDMQDLIKCAGRAIIVWP